MEKVPGWTENQMNVKEENKSLKPYLGLWSAVAINLGAIIGGGIFVVTGIAAGLAGSALVVSIVVAAVSRFSRL